MKVKVYVIDLEIPARVKRWALRLGIPAVVLLGGGAIAYAAGLVTWTDGQTLKAADLNANFSSLQSQITALQSATTYQNSTNCAYTSNGANSFTACQCGANQTAVGGGGYMLGGMAAWLVDSHQSQASQWAVACADSSGTRVQCSYAFVLCAQ